MGVVRITAAVKEKLEDQGKMCMLLGYVQNNTGGTYCMLNIHTKRTVLSRGVISLNKTYREYV